MDRLLTMRGLRCRLCLVRLAPPQVELLQCPSCGACNSMREIDDLQNHHLELPPDRGGKSLLSRFGQSADGAGASRSGGLLAQLRGKHLEVEGEGAEGAEGEEGEEGTEEEEESGGEGEEESSEEESLEEEDEEGDDEDNLATLKSSERVLIQRQAFDLKRVLLEYGVPVRSLSPKKAQVGPSVIRYRVSLDPGAKISSLQTRAKDIGRELSTKTTPFIDNIPGSFYVGVDLERPIRQVMPLEPAIEALPKPKGTQLPVVVGMSPSGENIHLDIVQLPHLLVAGSTNSGKTVFLHGILLSLIARLKPSDIEIIIVDPKATDFILYNGLPHVRGGKVITENEDAVSMLQGLTAIELKERTNILQAAGCPNISDYNAANPKKKLKPIVVVIDEYADLIMTLGKEVREAFELEINRLAQRARSVGIHLVLATQRPTTNIITGGLKANMPCRMSFRLPCSVDSRTILDRGGAENLFGRGDMLLFQNDGVVRLQGFYMPSSEMAEYLKQFREPEKATAKAAAAPVKPKRAKAKTKTKTKRTRASAAA